MCGSVLHVWQRVGPTGQTTKPPFKSCIVVVVRCGVTVLNQRSRLQNSSIGTFWLQWARYPISGCGLNKICGHVRDMVDFLVRPQPQIRYLAQWILVHCRQPSSRALRSALSVLLQHNVTHSTHCAMPNECHFHHVTLVLHGKIETHDICDTQSNVAT